MAQPQYTPVLPFEQLSPLIDAAGDCWEWTGRLTARGYGDLTIKIDGKWRNRRAHRLVWVALCGSIPDGLTLDHLCRLRRCVNPDHMEPVTNRVNILRGRSVTALNARRTHCKWGHNNWQILSNGTRQCRSCEFFHYRTRRMNIIIRKRLAAGFMTDRWRQSRMTVGYYVSADGCIRNWQWRSIKIMLTKGGIRMAKINLPSGAFRMRVDDLVADAFPELAAAGEG